MRNEPKVSVSAALALSLVHSHRWRIEEQSGPRSSGACECGLVRAFQNGWESDQIARLNSGGWTAQRPRAIRISR